MADHRAYQMYAHITWHTWERVGCIDTDTVGDIRSALVTASKATGIRVLQHNELADHVHLLVSFSPRHRLCDFLRQVKSVASFRAGRRVVGAVKWARGYYVATYHRKDLRMVANYIARQHERHPDLIPKLSRRPTSPAARRELGSGVNGGRAFHDPGRKPGVDQGPAVLHHPAGSRS